MPRRANPRSLLICGFCRESANRSCSAFEESSRYWKCIAWKTITATPVSCAPNIFRSNGGLRQFRRVPCPCRQSTFRLRLHRPKPLPQATPTSISRTSPPRLTRTLPIQNSDRLPQRRENLRCLLFRCAIRRHDHDHITDWPGEHAALRHGFADANARLFTQVEWFAWPPILHQLDAGNQPDLPDVPDPLQIPELVEPNAQIRFKRSARLYRYGRVQQFETRQRRRASKLVSSVAMAVKECFEV